MKTYYLAIGLLLFSAANAQTEPVAAAADIKPRTVDVTPPASSGQRTPPAGSVPSEPAPPPPPGTEVLVGEAAEKSLMRANAAAAVAAQPASAQGVQGPASGAAPATTEPTRDQRADARYNEMRRKITAAVEEVLQLYGNPSFAEIVTNDPVKAAELRQRLSTSTSSDQLKAEIALLEAKRDALKSDVALADRELTQARSQAARLRATIDQTVMALQSAQRTMEGEAKPVVSAP